MLAMSVEQKFMQSPQAAEVIQALGEKTDQAEPSMFDVFGGSVPNPNQGGCRDMDGNPRKCPIPQSSPNNPANQTHPW
jgi:hypothetical protein